MRGGIALPLAFSRCPGPAFPMSLLRGSSSALHSACVGFRIGQVMWSIFFHIPRPLAEGYNANNKLSTKELHDQDNRTSGTSRAEDVSQ
jgi:hypothetical protein